MAKSQEIQQDLVRFEVFEIHKEEIEHQNKLEQLRVRQHQLEQQRLKKLALAKEVEKKRKEQVSRSNEKKYRVLTMEATAYTAYCSTGCIGVVKTGKDVSNTIMHKGKYIIAVDPRVVKLHSIVKIEYQGNQFYAYALDTGGDIKNLRIDILMDTNSEAMNFGRKQVKVTIIREGK